MCAPRSLACALATSHAGAVYHLLRAIRRRAAQTVVKRYVSFNLRASVRSVPSKIAIATLIVSSPFLTACSGGGGSSAMPAAASNALAAAGTSTSNSSTTNSSLTRAVVMRGALAVMPPASADAFVDSIGADSHFNYGGTSYTTNAATVGAALISSGIRHLRDGEPQDNYASELAYLGANGIKHSVFFPVTTTAAQITATLMLYAPYVDFVEPQNEYDRSGDPNWAAALQAEQQLLYTTVQSNPAFAGIKVLGPSFARPADAASVGPLDQFEDAGNLHNYTCNLNPGTTTSIGISALSALIRGATATKPIWTTEVGYEDDLSVSACALSDAAIAKYTPRTIADRWLAGEPRTYLYQFADMAPATGYSAMGLVTQAGVPKPQFTALQSMISLLSDPGSGFATAPLAYTLGGNTQNVQQLLLQKRNGDYFLLLWLEVPSWNPQSQSPLGVAQQTVTLTFGSAITTATAYTYGSDWSLHGTGLPAPARQLSVSVGDSITFVKLHP